MVFPCLSRLPLSQGKESGYVYFEADCFFSSANPFISLDVAEPSLAQMDQKPLAVICPFPSKIVNFILFLFQGKKPQDNKIHH